MKISKIDRVSLAILSIFVLEGIALTQGINGTCLALAIAALAGLGGYEIHDVVNILKIRNVRK